MIEEKLTIKDLIKEIDNHYELISAEKENIYKYSINGSTIYIDNSDEENPKFCNGYLEHHAGRKNIFSLKNKENYSVVMLVIKLLLKGYALNAIQLEKPFQVGRGNKYLDLMLSNFKQDQKYMFEVKSNKEISKFVSKKSKATDTKQLLSYAIQDKNTKIATYYTYDFDEHKDKFYSIFIDDSLKMSNNIDEFYDMWEANGNVFDETDYINDDSIFGNNLKLLKYTQLKDLSDKITTDMHIQFLTLLRVHSISDKPNAFIKFINLLLCKILDEVTEDKTFNVMDETNNIHEVTGLKFQYIYNLDTPESFLQRLNALYKQGMEDYMHKKVINYTNEEIKKYIEEGNVKKIEEIIYNVSFKKENPFAFIEIYDDETFEENFLILKKMVELIQGYKFRYPRKHQFLGDFFELMLNTSLKQEAGQFFTPIPLVEFITSSIPYYENIEKNILEKKKVANSIPKVIDYACGSGHFLTSSMFETQKALDKIEKSDIKLTAMQKDDIERFCSKSQYSWVSTTNVIGIEKDYRLAKTSKITTSLNGDGNAEIVNGDGINKFNSEEYASTTLYSNNPKKDIEPSITIDKFDYVISNPPYSVKGYTKNLIKNKIKPNDDNFSLFTKNSSTDATIETLFVERAYQLLKPNGLAAIILPQSFLTSDKYVAARKFMYKYFKIVSMLLTADVTFAGTTTSPVVLFLKKKALPKEELDYNVLIISSPKYKNPTARKITELEKNFLGYQFSTNRNNLGITIIDDNILKTLSHYVKDMFLEKEIEVKNEDKEYVEIKKLSSIVLNGSETVTNMIYPKYEKVEGQKLFKLCDVNRWTLDDFNDRPKNYIEISNIQNGKIVHEFKKKLSSQLCKKGDILVSSLCPTKAKIAVADDDYMVTSAIHVLTCKNKGDRDKILKKLQSDEVIKQMNSLLDGFKITYSKISEDNLKNNVIL